MDLVEKIKILQKIILNARNFKKVIEGSKILLKQDAK